MLLFVLGLAVGMAAFATAGALWAYDLWRRS